MRCAVLLLALLACDSTIGMTSAKRAPSASIPLTPADDETLEKRIRSIFAEVDGLQDVRVDVDNGVVDLSGETDTLAYELKAAQLAGRVEGVAHVANKIGQRRTTRLIATTSDTLGHAALTVWRALPQVLAAVIVFIPFLVLFWLWPRWRPLRIFRLTPRTEAIVRFALRGTTLVTGLLLAFDVLGVMDILGALVGALGITGVIAGFAFKDWFANYLPRLILGLHPQFEAGDLIQVGDHEGRVVRMTPRATVIMTINGEELRIPNSQLYSQTIINFSHRRERRLRFSIPLSPGADLSVAEDVGCDALRAIEGVMADPPPFMRVRDIDMEILYVTYFAWVDQELMNFRTVESFAKRAVIEALRSSSVPRPENSMVVKLRHQRAQRAQHESHNAEHPERDRKLLDERLADVQAKLSGAS